MQNNKERNFWSKLLGSWNSKHHRVFSILGIRIKIRSKYLMLRERMLEVESTNRSLKQEIQKLQKTQIDLINSFNSYKNHLDEQVKTLSSLLSVEIKNQSSQFNEKIKNQSSQFNEKIKEQCSHLSEKIKDQCSPLNSKINNLSSLIDKKDQTLNKTIENIKTDLNKQKQQFEKQIETLDKQAKQHKTECNTKAENIKRDYITRIGKLDQAIKYKIHKYCPSEKYPTLICDWYRERMQGKELNLSNPLTYTEKVQWSKLYDSTPIKTLLADKYLVRDWVAERIGSDYLIPLLGVWDKFDDINFDTLPNRFALKCNHGYAYNLIVKDKSELNLDDARQKITSWMNENFAFKALELHYDKIPHKIIAEEFIENKSSPDGDLYDYKFWCFNGKVKYIQFLSERYTNGLKMAFFDTNWQKQDFTYGVPLYSKNVPRPDNLEEMIAVVEKLAAGFNHVRVDLYRMDDGKLYFGEMTFTPAAGAIKWQLAEMDKILGDMYILPEAIPY